MIGALKNRRALLAVAGSVAAAVVAVLLVLVVGGGGGSGDKAPLSRAEQRAADRGWTDKVTVPLSSPKHYQASVPRPDVLPPMIRSTGECATAMNAVRDFQDDNPSGLTLSPAQAKKLSKLLQAVDPQLSATAACSDALAGKFRLQELNPWLLWQPPATPNPSPQGDPTPGSAPADPNSKGSTK